MNAFELIRELAQKADHNAKVVVKFGDFYLDVRDVELSGGSGPMQQCVALIVPQTIPPTPKEGAPFTA